MVYIRIHYNIVIALGTWLFLVPMLFHAEAHVIVKPNEVGIGTYQTFVVNVPSEKEVSTTEVRLVLPQGLNDVTPLVKTGWTTTIKKQHEKENATVSEIDWTGGLIPSGQQDEFSFSAQVPGKTATLAWKAYQTYEDGTVVSWNQEPSGNEKDDDTSDKGPYSTTLVVDDLNPSKKSKTQPENQEATAAFGISIAALAIAGVALIRASRR